MTNPESPKVTAVYEAAQAEALSKYGDRIHAVYLIGSLAHGGFSESSSDIDVAFILNQPEITEDDWAAFDQVDQSVKGSDLEFGKKLSLFWSTKAVLSTEVTSGAFPAPTREQGVFPPYDVLDLLQNGRLLYGDDTRETFRKPTVDDLYIAGVEFSLSFVNTDENNTAIVSEESFDQLSDHDKTKLILFPVRLIYTLSSGRVGDNIEAAKMYLDTIDEKRVNTGDISELEEQACVLVRQAMAIRETGEYDHDAMSQGFPGLKLLYSQLISQYSTKMVELQKSDYVRQLGDWRQRLLPEQTQ